jgi:hypothetical protein
MELDEALDRYVESYEAHEKQRASCAALKK